MTKLRNSIKSKEIPENKNPKKAFSIVKKIIDLDKKQKGTGIEISTLKQMLQRLRIALAHVKVGNTSENLLDEMKQIIYSLYQEKEVTKKVCNNVMKSIKV